MSETFDKTKYMQDSFGRLVPIESVHPTELLRNQTVEKIIENARIAQEAMRTFKVVALEDVHTFCGLSAEQYGIEWGGKKGNVSLTSYNGKYKVQLAISDSLNFDERLQIAKALIDECIHEWSQTSNVQVRTLIEHAFQTDREGKINVGRIFGLMRVKIEDEKWKMAMDALRDSIQVTATSSYLRLYEREGDSDQYKQIPLDMAKL
jgi:hypothetical protein